MIIALRPKQTFYNYLGQANSEVYDKSYMLATTLKFLANCNNAISKY